MIKQTITYTGFDGIERTEDFYFHFNHAELQEWNMRYGATLGEQLQNAIHEENWDLVTDTLKRIVSQSYGRRSPDGKSFIKTESWTQHFVGSDAYSQLFVRLVTDQEFSAEFINNVIPADVAAGNAQITPQQPGQTMNRAQRRAQPQDYQKKQQAQPVQRPVQQPDPIEYPVFGEEPVQEQPIEGDATVEPNMPPSDNNDEFEQFQAWKRAQNQQ